MRWEEKPRQRTRIADGLNMSMSFRQMECSRKRSLVARLLPVFPPNMEIFNHHSDPKPAVHTPVFRRSGEGRRHSFPFQFKEASASAIHSETPLKNTRRSHVSRTLSASFLGK